MPKPPKSLTDALKEGWLWLYWADRDYIAARILFLCHNPQLWMPASLQAHKALEEYLKAALRSYGDVNKWGGLNGHNLPHLATECAKYDNRFACANLLQALTTFFKYYQTYEYPDASGTAQPLGSDDLGLLDQTVSLVRPCIRFQVFFPSVSNFPTTLRDLLSADLPETKRLFQWARKKNAYIDRM